MEELDYFMVIAYKVEQVNTKNKLLIDFGPKHFKIRMLSNGNISDVFKFPNTLFHISETRVQNLEREFKDAFILKSGMFTRAEVEAAQLLLQADEKLVDLANKVQIERAYTNLFEILPDKLGIDFRTGEIDFESWSVFLTVPVTSNFDDMLKTHLNILKSIGFIYIKPTDYLTSSFYSQKSLIGAENVKHKYGILVNVSDKTEIGVFDEELIENGYSQLSLGVNTVIEYSLAILRDLNIRGFKRELLEEWVQIDGTCLNDAQTVIKNIRKKDTDIKILLNSPYILFDYFKVTGMKNDVNSIPEGIINLLQSNKKIKKNINKILSNVIIVGPGSSYRGFGLALKSTLSLEFGNLINVIEGKDPTNSEINGLYEYLSTFDHYDCFNITKIEIDDSTRKTLEKQNELIIKSIESKLKEIKSKNLYHLENLSTFNDVMKSVFQSLKDLPEGLDTYVESKIFSETQKFAKDFAKQLSGYKKSSEKNLEKASQNLQILQTFANEINRFSIAFVNQLFSNQLSNVLSDVRKIKLAFEEKITNELVKTILKQLQKELNKEQWIMIEDLAEKTKLSIDQIEKVSMQVIIANPEIGFLDGRFLKYSSDLLTPASNFLDQLIQTIDQKISSNNSFELKEDFEQALTYCNFLIGGFNSLNYTEFLENAQAKKEYLLEERKRIFQIL
jgi:hypothetical protein